MHTSEWRILFGACKRVPIPKYWKNAIGSWIKRCVNIGNWKFMSNGGKSWRGGILPVFLSMSRKQLTVRRREGSGIFWGNFSGGNEKEKFLRSIFRQRKMRKILLGLFLKEKMRDKNFLSNFFEREREKNFFVGDFWEKRRIKIFGGQFCDREWEKNVLWAIFLKKTRDEKFLSTVFRKKTRGILFVGNFSGGDKKKKFCGQFSEEKGERKIFVWVIFRGKDEKWNVWVIFRKEKRKNKKSSKYSLYQYNDELSIIHLPPFWRRGSVKMVAILYTCVIDYRAHIQTDAPLTNGRIKEYLLQWNFAISEDPIVRILIMKIHPHIVRKLSNLTILHSLKFYFVDNATENAQFNLGLRYGFMRMTIKKTRF